MITGNLQGLVNGTEQVVFDYEVTGSAVSSISTGNILNGNEDGWYTIIIRAITPSENNILIQCNADATAINYGYRGIYGVGTTVLDTSATSSAGLRVGYANTAGSAFLVARIYAKTGAVRMCNSVGCGAITAGTTVNYTMPISSMWANTADNIINLKFLLHNDNFSVGSRIIILKSNNFTNGTPTGAITAPYIKGAWVRVGSQVLGSPASSVTFSGLDGDRDVLYYLAMSASVGTASDSFYVRVNGDSSSSNYGFQQLRGVNTTVNASRATDAGYVAVGLTLNNLNQMSHLIFAKTGFLRPALTTLTKDVSSTTVSTVQVIGCSYSNTATNITSLSANLVGSGVFAAGSQFDLYALRPNG